MKKIAIALFAVFIISSGITAGAETVLKAPSTEETTKSSVISLFADEIEIKIRYNNGVRQYRRWNKTKGYWVDPYWINF